MDHEYERCSILLSTGAASETISQQVLLKINNSTNLKNTLYRQIMARNKPVSKQHALYAAGKREQDAQIKGGVMSSTYNTCV